MAKKKHSLPKLEFQVKGPYVVKKTVGPRGGISYKITTRNIEIESLLEKTGCYVYVLRSKYKEKTYRLPIYAGKTIASFKTEIFQDHKSKKLDEALEGSRKQLEVFLFPLVRRRGSIPAIAVDDAESYLIRECFDLNPELKNKRKLGQRKWEIKGVTGANRGRPIRSAQAFNEMWD